MRGKFGELKGFMCQWAVASFYLANSACQLPDVGLIRYYLFNMGAPHTRRVVQVPIPSSKAKQKTLLYIGRRGEVPLAACEKGRLYYPASDIFYRWFSPPLFSLLFLFMPDSKNAHTPEQPPAEDEGASPVDEPVDPHADNPLFKLSVPEYLETSVATVLTQALEDLCRFRPANPVDYLALYLLRRAQPQNVVEVPFSEAVPQVQETYQMNREPFLVTKDGGAYPTVCESVAVIPRICHAMYTLPVTGELKQELFQTIKFKIPSLSLVGICCPGQKEQVHLVGYLFRLYLWCVISVCSSLFSVSFMRKKK
eukprot:gene10159-7113_t